MSNDENNSCSYKNCNNTINKPYHIKFCVFHAPKKYKGIPIEDFNKLIEDKREKNDLNFEGYVFPEKIVIKGSFGPTSFKNAKFDVVSFVDVNFRDFVNFENVDFKKGTHFIRTQFKNSVNFSYSTFFKQVTYENVEFTLDANFSHCKFLNGVEFVKCRFDQRGNFKNTKIIKGRFRNSKIYIADFTNAEFLGIFEFEYNDYIYDAIFLFAKFKDDVYFVEDHFEYSNFSEILFSGNVNFMRCIFVENSFFEKNKFEKSVAFRNLDFKKSINFFESVFKEIVMIDHCDFSAVDFNACQFNDHVSFINVKFRGIAVLTSTNYYSRADFVNVNFMDDFHFHGAGIYGDVVFKDVIFNKKVYFIENCINASLTIKNLKIAPEVSFHFLRPSFLENKEKNPNILFENIHFNPFNTNFESFPSPDKNKISYAVFFRDCKLKDVYFTKNNMSYFSFYKSNFDQARFISSNWRTEKDSIFSVIPYKRKNILFEDFLFINIPANLKEKSSYFKKFHIEDINLNEIAGLYRRMKTAYDLSKDYKEAGWFYFNEFEIKRKESKFSLFYYLYKIISGYGEKPAWSLIWFLFFLISFSIIHLLSGINTAKGIINYDISLKFESIKNIFSLDFWGDWFNSLVFTFYRLIPVNFMPAPKYTLTPIGLDGQLWSILNTLILILMITFMGIGLKRQFRRF